MAAGQVVLLGVVLGWQIAVALVVAAAVELVVFAVLVAAVVAAVAAVASTVDQVATITADYPYDVIVAVVAHELNSVAAVVEVVGHYLVVAVEVLPNSDYYSSWAVAKNRAVPMVLVALVAVDKLAVLAVD